jgi:hypothetical protein
LFSYPFDSSVEIFGFRGRRYTLNFDFTNITISPSQAYGNATHIPIVTVSANGRINAISTVAVTATDPSAIAFAIALG